MHSIITPRLILLITMLRFALAFQYHSTSRIQTSLSRSHVSSQMVERLYSSSNNNINKSSLSSDELVNLAKKFINKKNAAGSGQSTLDGVFDMCSPSVDLYGLKGDDVRPGFTSFFESHDGLHHELLDEPSVVGSDGAVVQYAFMKRWRSSDGEDLVWKSIDMAKPRNKVERLWFGDEGKLEKVSVVDADVPLD